jgi:hypothetical protein
MQAQGAGTEEGEELVQNVLRDTLYARLVRDKLLTRSRSALLSSYIIIINNSVTIRAICLHPKQRTLSRQLLESFVVSVHGHVLELQRIVAGRVGRTSAVSGDLPGGPRWLWGHPPPATRTYRRSTHPSEMMLSCAFNFVPAAVSDLF